MTNKRKQTVELGTKALDVADKGLSLIDNLATIMSAIKWIIIVVILYVIYSIGTWFIDLVPSSEDFNKAKAAAAVKVDSTKQAISTATISTKQNVEEAVDDVRTTVIEAKDELDENVAVNNAKDAVKSKYTELKSKLPTSWFKKDDQPREPTESDENKKSVDNVDP